MPITKDDIKSEITLDKTEVKIDLKRELKGLPSSVKKQISAEVADLLRREIGNDAVNNALSSVTGKRFKGLSPDYKKLKKEEGKGTRANLVFDGDMLGNFTKSNGVESIKLKITKAKQIKKFYNHNFGDTLPQRQALPFEGESFRPGIMRKINKAIRDAKKANKET